MTKPRTSVDREIFGILGKHPERSALQRTWNAYFEAEGIDAFLDYYPTTEDTIHERLSEMYHFDRRAYIVGSALTEAILSYVDVVHPSAEQALRQGSGQGSANLLYNRGGVVEGWHIEDMSDPEKVLAILQTGE